MTEQRSRKEEKQHRRKGGLTGENQRMQLAQHGETTQPDVHKNRDVSTNLRKLLIIKDRRKVVSVLADGHCLFRAVWKILHNMEPGTVMKEAKAHMINRPPDEGYYVTETEIVTRVTRHIEFEMLNKMKEAQTYTAEQKIAR